MRISLCTDRQASVAHSKTRILSYNRSRMIAVHASRLLIAILFCILVNQLGIVVRAQNHCKGGTLYGNLSPRQVKIAKDVEIAFCRGRNLLGSRAVPEKKMYDFIYSQLKYQQSKKCMKNHADLDRITRCLYSLYNVIEIWECFGVAAC